MSVIPGFAPFKGIGSQIQNQTAIANQNNAALASLLLDASNQRNQFISNMGSAANAGIGNVINAANSASSSALAKRGQEQEERLLLEQLTQDQNQFERQLGQNQSQFTSAQDLERQKLDNEIKQQIKEMELAESSLLQERDLAKSSLAQDLQLSQSALAQERDLALREEAMRRAQTRVDNEVKERSLRLSEGEYEEALRTNAMNEMLALQAQKLQERKLESDISQQLSPEQLDQQFSTDRAYKEALTKETLSRVNNTEGIDLGNQAIFEDNSPGNVKNILSEASDSEREGILKHQLSKLGPELSLLLEDGKLDRAEARQLKRSAKPLSESKAYLSEEQRLILDTIDSLKGGNTISNFLSGAGTMAGGRLRDSYIQTERDNQAKAKLLMAALGILE